MTHVQVTAVDIYPARLPEEPDNLAIEIWDLNHSLIPAYTPGSYDLIHSRFIAGGIKKNRWRSYVRELSRLLQRGGWLQMVEYHFIIQSDSGLLTDAHAIQQWQNAYKWYMEQEKDPRVGRRLSQLMRDAGLDSIQEYTYRLPIGSWPTGESIVMAASNEGAMSNLKLHSAGWTFRICSRIWRAWVCIHSGTNTLHVDARQQYIGGKNLDNFSEMLESHAVWPFTQLAGWSREAVDSVVARARVELRDPRLKLYIPL